MQRLFPGLAMASLLLSPVTAPGIAQTQPVVERMVHGHVLTSRQLPAVTIAVPESFTYVGAVRWPLYNVADCELHAFAETDAAGHVKRLIWIQFEGFLPEKPDLHYGYNSRRHVEIDGRDFFVDTFARPKGASTQAGSDREHIEALLAARGALMPEKMNYVRLVHLLDDTKRRELMIIYGEVLPASDHGTSSPSAADNRETSLNDDARALLNQAVSALKLRFAS